MPSATTPFRTLTLTSPNAYIHLSFLSSVPINSPPDMLTLHTLLITTLSQYLGLHGSAIPFDILKTEGSDMWIRVQREDFKGVLAAVGQWESEGRVWRVRDVGGWVGRGAEGKGVWG